MLGLVAGLGIGAAVAATGVSAGPIAAAADVVGTMWINAILMTILPLVVSKLIVSIAGHEDGRTLGRAGRRAAVLIVGLQVATAVLAAAVMPPVFAWLPIDPATSATLRSAVPAAASQGTLLPMGQWIVAFLPANVFRAAADGVIVPVLVFSLLFAMATRRIPAPQRDPLVALFRAVDAAITVLLQWIVACSPIGVFALGLALALRVGTGVVSALAYYIVISSAVMVVITAALYFVVYAGGRVSPGRFARAVAPAQVVAFGTHSSMAALPSMLEAAQTCLGVSPTGTGFVLPMALAVFKYSGPAWFVIVACFIGRLYGMAIDPSRLVAVVVVSVITSFAIGGVPSGAAVVVAPVLAAAGLPAEAMGMLLAVDPIPNAFRTVANVTGMLAVTVLADGEAAPTP